MCLKTVRLRVYTRLIVRRHLTLLQTFFMRNTVITVINNNLSNAVSLIDSIDDDIYTNITVGPYYSSIGSHIRHLLDFFDCIINGLETNNIDLTARKRDEVISSNPEAAKKHIVEIQQKLISFTDVSTDYLLNVTDNLGEGNVTVMYTLESILAHANSHATHHYAIISYMLSTLNVNVEIPGFGYNPSTPVPNTEKA